MGSFPYPKGGALKVDYENVLIFKKLGKVEIPTKKGRISLDNGGVADFFQYSLDVWSRYTRQTHRCLSLKSYLIA